MQYYRLPMYGNQNYCLLSTMDSNTFVKMSKLSLFFVPSFEILCKVIKTVFAPKKFKDLFGFKIVLVRKMPYLISFVTKFVDYHSEVKNGYVRVFQLLRNS